MCWLTTAGFVGTGTCPRFDRCNRGRPFSLRLAIGATGGGIVALAGARYAPRRGRRGSRASVNAPMRAIDGRERVARCALELAAGLA